MSLKSRLGSEVTNALNTLTLISLSVRTSHTDHQGLAFPLAACGGLVDELLDLLEETAFGVDGEFDDNKQSDEEASAAPLSYRELFRVVTQEETELAELPTPAASKRPTSVGEDGLCPLEPIDTILVLTNLLRNFAIADENVKVFGSNPRVLAVLVRVANLPLRRDGVPKGRWPLQVTAGQSMAIRKDVLETITNFAIDVRLDTHSSETAASLFRLLLFFVLDADHQDQLYFDLSTSPSATSRMPQAAPTRMSHYLDIGLAAFARVTTPDVNRYIFAEHAPVDMFALFESLVHLLPITESEFQLVTSEPGLIFAESLATSLYNLAFLAPPELKVRLRVVPGFIRAFLRVVKRLIGTTTDPNDNPFVTLCDHCIATLTLLSEVGGMSPGGQKTSGGLWFGLGPLTDETEKPSGPAPTEADRASAKARQPPKSGGHPAPAVLSGDPRQIFDLLSQGLAIPFTKLSALLDASSGKKE